MRALFHIGMAKTGSSAVQRAFENFDNGRVRFARLGNRDHSIPMRTIFDSEPQNYAIHRRFGRTRDEVDRLKGQFEKALQHELSVDRELIVFSGEGTLPMSGADMERMTKYLLGQVESIEFLAYIRPPKSYMQSLFQQLIKGQLSTFTLTPPKYRFLLEKFARPHNRTSISFAKYDRSILRDGDIVSDFSDRIGVDRPLGHFNTNEGLSLEASCLLYLQNKYGSLNFGSEAGVRARGKLRQVLSSVGSSKFAIADNVLEQYLDPEDVAWMENRSGFSLSESPSSPSVCLRSEEDIERIAKSAFPELSRALAEATRQSLEGVPPHIAQTAYLALQRTLIEMS